MRLFAHLQLRPCLFLEHHLLSIFFSRSSPLVEEFTSRFPGMSFQNVLSEFSLPAPLSQHNNPLGLPQQKVQLPEYLFYRWGVAVSTAKSQNLPLHVALNELFVVLL